MLEFLELFLVVWHGDSFGHFSVIYATMCWDASFENEPDQKVMEDWF